VDESKRKFARLIWPLVWATIIVIFLVLSVYVTGGFYLSLKSFPDTYSYIIVISGIIAFTVLYYISSDKCTEGMTHEEEEKDHWPKVMFLVVLLLSVFLIA
jgi:predicted nucleic acid-binding Zn ribbon protein